MDDIETREGPKPFVCAYLNGKSAVAPPLLLALDGVKDVAGLLDAANDGWKRSNLVEFDTLKVAYHPDGVVLPKQTHVRELPPNCVIVFGSTEPFDAASLPERARSMYKSMQRRQQLLGPLRRTAPVESRFELGPSSARTQRPGVGGAGSPRGRSPSPRPQGQDSPRARSASPAANRLHSDPWMFSPSGKWDTPLALRHDAR